MGIKAATRLGIVLVLLTAASEPARSASAPPEEAKKDAVYPAELVAADFADLYAELRASHYDLYARVSKGDYDQLFTRMRDEIRLMTAAQVVDLFQRFMAFGRVAHARVDAAGDAFAAYRDGGGAEFPLTIRMVEGRMFVARNESGNPAVVAGDEIMSLDSRSVADWLERASHRISADTPYMLGALLEWDFGRILWAERGAVPTFALRLRRPGIADFTAVVPARSSADMKAAGRALPPRLDLSWEKREARMLDGRIAYLRPGPTYNVGGDQAHMYDNTGFRTFIDQAFDSFLAAGASDMLLDLRDNPGGDNSFSDIMIAWFATAPFRVHSRFRIKVSSATVASNAKRMSVPGNDPTGMSAKMARAYAGVTAGQIIDFPVEQAQPRRGRRFAGRVYALINRQSYSNTVAIAATIQENRFGTILGEETSDLATTYGAMEHFTLPRTHIVVGYPKALIVRPNGDERARGVVPDIAIPTPVVEGPDDPVLRRAIAIVRERRARGS